MKKTFIVVIMTYLLFCSGCLYIPYHTYYYRMPDEKTLASMKEDVTSKKNVLLMLGEPNRVLDNERIFLYWWQEVHGYVLWLIPYGSSGGPVKSTHWLYIEFEENNIIKKCEIKKRDVFSWNQTLIDNFYETSGTGR